MHIRTETGQLFTLNSVAQHMYLLWFLGVVFLRFTPDCHVVAVGVMGLPGKGNQYDAAVCGGCS